jgi:hypothetical protein
VIGANAHHTNPTQQALQTAARVEFSRHTPTAS